MISDYSHRTHKFSTGKKYRVTNDLAAELIAKGKAVKGSQIFDPLTVEYLKKIDGIGQGTAEKLVQDFRTISTLKAAIEKGKDVVVNDGQLKKLKDHFNI